jgi:hypothetical protein
MADRYQITKDILDLVDSNPMNNIDIAPIVEKHTSGLDREGQGEPRMAIRTILTELKRDSEIDFNDQFLSNLTTRMAGVYVGNSGMIRSTRKRQKEIEEKKTKEKPNKIQLATRRNILDGFLITRISWHGSLEQSDFLARLYDLSQLPSYDSRYKTAQEDIHKHTVLNNDWPEEWVFTDNRFNILHGSDKEFLDFLCMTLHPTVRSNPDELTTLLEIYTNNLERDGFTIEQTHQLAGRPIFSSSEFNPTKTTSASITGVASIRKAENRKALVVGCSSYQYANVLVNPLNDANEMEEILKSLGFEVLKKIDPTQKELKIIIDEFGEKLKGSDVGLFYFAGHGVQVKGLNYLIPVEANLKTEKMVEYDCVEASRVLAYMEEVRTPVNLMILDACRNNPFERSWGRGIGQRGLASMSAPQGSLIAYSTAPGTTASDGTGSNGLYTEALLNHISTKGTSIHTMFQKVRRDVMEKSKDEQVPWESTSLTADFYFNQ